ncbi:MAG: rhomboid family intramembrane serine protease [Desulfobacterales bacterium]|nr:rhomboid family intramembrane serine protease [Desulfobacterales bacterium]
MLIIPIVGNISWRHPPYVTLLFILINCSVFFLFQSGEDHKMIEVYSQYFDSGLSDIEVPRYISFIENKEGASELVSEYHNLKDQEDADAPEEYAHGMDNGQTLLEVQILMAMENDSDFMNALYRGSIVPETDDAYGKWKTLRAEFDNNKESLITYRFGLVPARIKPYSFLTCIFLHGGFGHLFGNMIFLWIVGCVLEMGCGRLIYGIGYLVVGCCASLFFFLVHSSSHVPMIGASGAISGLMGALTVFYGISRIKVFFSTGFYFDYFRIPAIALLPFWIGTELFQYFRSADDQVAYMAHAGGLASGALLGMMAKTFIFQSRKTYFAEAPGDTSAVMLEEAVSRIGKLDYAGARALLMNYLALKPDNIEALGHLFNIDKHHPKETEFSESARRLLSALLKNRADAEKIWKFYAEYEKISRPVRLPADLQIRLASLFCDNDHLQDAEKLITLLIQTEQTHPNMPTTLMRLVKALDKSGAPEKAASYRKILLEKFPMSPEVRLAG